MTVCPSCGAKLKKNYSFCPACGTPLSQPALPKENEKTEILPYKKVIRHTELPNGYVEQVEFSLKEKRRWNLRKVLLLLLLLAAVTGAAVLFSRAFVSSSRYCIMKDQLYAFSLGENQWIGLSKSGKTVSTQITGDLLHFKLSRDGRKLAFVTETKELWLFDGKSFTMIAQDVSEEDQYLLTPDGETLVYLTDSGALVLYSRQPRRIADNVEKLFALSPDGKTVAFARTVKDSLHAFLYNGEEEDLGKNLTVHALSENGRFIYLSHTNGIFYVQKEADEDSRVRLGKNPVSVQWNGKQNEVLLFDGEKTVFSENGEEPVTVADAELIPLRKSGYRAVPTFKDILALCSEEGTYRLVRLDSALKTKTVVRDVRRACLADNGDQIVYQQGSGLYVMPVQASAAESRKLASEVNDGWLISRDKKAVFYCSDGISWYQKLDKDAVTVTEYTVKAECAVGTNTFLYQMDGITYYTSGEKGSRISGFNGEADKLAAAYQLLELDLEDSFWCLAVKDDQLYLTTDGRKFSKIIP